MVRRKLLGLISCCCVVGIIAGCERQPIIVETVVPESQLRLMRIYRAYTSFVDRYGRAPSDEKDLLPLLATQLAEEVVPATVLTSTNGLPFVICYGLPTTDDLSWAQATPVLAYEQTSSGQAEDGKRWVLTVPGAILQMSEDEFRSASFPPGHAPILMTDTEDPS